MNRISDTHLLSMINLPFTSIRKSVRDFLTELQFEDYEVITSEMISGTCIPSPWWARSVIQPRITRVPLKECYPYPSGKKFIYF